MTPAVTEALKDRCMVVIELMNDDARETKTLVDELEDHQMPNNLLEPEEYRSCYATIRSIVHQAVAKLTDLHARCRELEGIAVTLDAWKRAEEDDTIDPANCGAVSTEQLARARAMLDHELATRAHEGFDEVQESEGAS